jgi:preprotein translocase subunit SecG
MITLLEIVLFLVALFLILLVMVQRGKGGGLAGAFGGMGGQSAFGTKAGDLFTRVTIVVAAVWIILCMVCVRLLSGGASDILSGPPASTSSANPGAASKTKPAETATAPAGAPQPAQGGAGAGATAPGSNTGGAKPGAAK